MVSKVIKLRKQTDGCQGLGEGETSIGHGVPVTQHEQVVEAQPCVCVLILYCTFKHAERGQRTFGVLPRNRMKGVVSLCPPVAPCTSLAEWTSQLTAVPSAPLPSGRVLRVPLLRNMALFLEVRLLHPHPRLPSPSSPRPLLTPGPVQSEFGGER